MRPTCKRKQLNCAEHMGHKTEACVQRSSSGRVEHTSGKRVCVCLCLCSSLECRGCRTEKAKCTAPECWMQTGHSEPQHLGSQHLGSLRRPLPSACNQRPRHTAGHKPGPAGIAQGSRRTCTSCPKRAAQTLESGATTSGGGVIRKCTVQTAVVVHAGIH